jgi:O-antigen/teichoic acid export membrane protein
MSGAPAPVADPRDRSLISGTRVLSVGIASTGIFTFAYLAVASHVLSPRDYGRVSLAWAVMFVILSVIYRPIEQLLSRTIAERRARGHTEHPLRIPATLQLGFALGFVIVALAARHALQHRLLGGSTVLYWVLVVGVTAYAGSYFARGWLAGHEAFAFYGALVFLESISRFLCAVAAAVGIGSGLAVVAAGMAVAPFASLAVIPVALRRVRRRLGGDRDDPRPAAFEDAERGGVVAPELSLRGGAGFAAAVVAIMLSEQTLMNAGVLVVALSVGSGDLGAGLTGFVFNVMLIARAPLQLFQAVQTSILPHLSGLEAQADGDRFRRAITVTAALSAGFGLAVALGLLAAGPPVMGLLLGHKGFRYERVGLAVIGLGMGLHLVAGTLNQAALARRRPGRAAACWLTCAALFLAFEIAGPVAARVTRVEVGYAGATALLCLLLAGVYRTGAAAPAAASAPAAQSAPAASASAR